MRRFGHRRRQRSDNATGVVEGIELQRDGSTNYFLLPFEWHCEVAHPAAPIVRGLLVHMPPGLVRARRERLVGTEDKGQRALDQQAARLDHVCDRRVRGQP